jgi:phosphoribosylaminoimidazole-succinocarboxamide synthase
LAVKFNNNKDLYEESLKKDHSIDENDYKIVHYPDFFTTNGKKVKVKSLGEKFASLNSFFLDYLKEYHIPAAYINSSDKNSLRFLNYERFPFEVKILNIIDKRTAKIFGKKEHELLPLPIFEFHVGNGKESLISESHLSAFEICTYDDMKLINRICSKVNAVLKSFFERRETILAEVNCSFGKHEDKIYIVDDFTPKSLKIFPLNKDPKSPDPYKLTTASEIKKYTDHLHSFKSV